MTTKIFVHKPLPPGTIPPDPEPPGEVDWAEVIIIYLIINFLWGFSAQITFGVWFHG